MTAGRPTVGWNRVPHSSRRVLYGRSVNAALAIGGVSAAVGGATLRHEVALRAAAVFRRCFSLVARKTASSLGHLLADAQRHPARARMAGRAARSRRPTTMMKTTPTSPSLTSLFSSLTQTSAGSSGSSSTVTPASVSRARQRPSRHSVAVAKPSSRPRRPMAPVDEKPNVFAFMEDEEDQTAASGPASSSIPPAPSPHSPPGDYNHAWGEEAPAGSLCSDSGISVRSASPPPATAATYHKLASQPARRRKESRSASHGSDASRASDMGPEAFYALAPRPQRDHEGGHARGLARSRRRVAELDASRTGYDLVASALSSQAPGALQPVYRTFETLNHRILLYLQDEISELEEGLRAVDAAIAQSEKAVGLVAASRRMEMKMPSQLQWQRMELVGRSMAKLDQYSESFDPWQGGGQATDRRRSCVVFVQRAVSVSGNGLAGRCCCIPQLARQSHPHRAQRDLLPRAS